MIRVLEDGRIVKIMQNRLNPHIKVAYISKGGKSFERVFEGTIVEIKKWLKHQKVLAYKCASRQLISDICGTSYSVACKDMGI